MDEAGGRFYLKLSLPEAVVTDWRNGDQDGNASSRLFTLLSSHPVIRAVEREDGTFSAHFNTEDECYSALRNSELLRIIASDRDGLTR